MGRKIYVRAGVLLHDFMSVKIQHIKVYYVMMSLYLRGCVRKKSLFSPSKPSHIWTSVDSSWAKSWLRPKGWAGQTQTEARTNFCHLTSNSHVVSKLSNYYRSSLFHYRKFQCKQFFYDGKCFMLKMQFRAFYAWERVELELGGVNIHYDKLFSWIISAPNIQLISIEV